MSTRRYDTSQRASPLGLWNSRLHAEGMRPWAEIPPIEREATEGKQLFLSVVVAAKNEAANLSQLVDEIASALRPLCNDGLRGLARFEIIVVDDASTDETRLVLKDLSEAYPELRSFTLAPGVGQSSATVAGIRAARGNWIATLDADLQNNPADLVRLWNALPGYDAALGWRVTRQDIWSKRVISGWANRVRNVVLGQSIRDTGCSVRIFPRAIAVRLPMFHGMHRFVGPLLLREGCRLIQVPVSHRPRLRGWSHYNLWNRSLSVIIDLLGVTWLMHRPVRYRVIQTLQSWEVVDDSASADMVPATARKYQGG
jgi:glycosyltransferase involved in cell wall biosynthesis